MGMGKRVAQLRHMLHLTQEEVVARMARLGCVIDRSYLSQIEGDKIQLPSREILKALAKCLETTEEDLLRAAGYLSSEPPVSESSLDRKERELVELYRRLSPIHQRALLDMIDGLRYIEVAQRGLAAEKAREDVEEREKVGVAR